MEYQPITPTEPIPEVTGSPLTYEQGERLLQLLTDLKTDIVTNHDAHNLQFSEVKTLLEGIKTNTIPVPIDTVSNPSGIAMTYEQGQALISMFADVQAVALTLTLAVALVFVSKFLYRLIGGTFFG